MSITSILRNPVGSPSIVFIQSTADLTSLTAPGYLASQQTTIDDFNNGPFTFNEDDFCLINYQNGEGFFNIDLSSGTLTPSAPPAGLSNSLPEGFIFVGNASNVATPASPSTISTSPSGVAGGDLTGSYPNPLLGEINGVPLDLTPLNPASFLIYNGTHWKALTITGRIGISATGYAVVTGLGNYPISDATPTSGNMLLADGSGWATRSMSGDGTIDAFGQFTLPNTGVTAGSYTINGSTLFTVDAKGRLTFADSLTISDTGITTLNTLTATTQTFATGTTGNDFNISSATSTHTFNIPSASATARGLVTTGSQTFAGAKTFTSSLILSNGLNIANTSNIGLTYSAPTVNFNLGGNIGAGDRWDYGAFGNGVFVLVSTNTNATRYSTDLGVTWNTGGTIPGTDVSVESVGYGDGAFVVTKSGSTETAYSLNNGVTWTAGGSVTSAAYTDIAFGSGNFVTIGGAKAAYTSDRGATWTDSSGTLPSPGIFSYTSIAFGNDTFIGIIGGSTTTAISTDGGASWSSGGAMPSAAGWTSIAFGENTFVAVGGGTSAAYSTNNGTSWTSSTLPSSQSWTEVVYQNSVFFAMAGLTTVGAYSLDGITWVAVTLPTPVTDTTWRRVIPGAGSYLLSAGYSGGGENPKSATGFFVASPQSNSVSGNNQLLTFADLFNGNVLLPSAALPPATFNSSGAVSRESSGTFAVSATGFTVVGSPTYVGNYSITGKILTFTITAISTVSIAATAGTSYFTGMPFNPSVISICSATDSAFLSYGVGQVQTNGRVYIPAVGATGSTIIISGMYQIA